MLGEGKAGERGKARGRGEVPHVLRGSERATARDLVSANVRLETRYHSTQMPQRLNSVSCSSCKRAHMARENTARERGRRRERRRASATCEVDAHTSPPGTVKPHERARYGLLGRQDLHDEGERFQSCSLKDTTAALERWTQGKRHLSGQSQEGRDQASWNCFATRRGGRAQQGLSRRDWHAGGLQSGPR